MLGIISILGIILLKYIVTIAQLHLAKIQGKVDPSEDF